MVAPILLALINQNAFDPGLSLRVYDIQLPISELTTLVPGQTPNIDRRIDAIDFPEGSFGLKQHFIAELSGEFWAKSDGDYSFKLSSDDGSQLLIDDKVVADNDGVHAVQTVPGHRVLKAGWHKIFVRFFQDAGGDFLRLEFKAPTETGFKVVGSDVLRCPAGLTRVTAPGQKLAVGLGGKRRPGNGVPLTTSHPGWKIETIHPDDWSPQVGCMAFRGDGGLLVGTFKPNQSGSLNPPFDGKVWLVENALTASGNGVKVKLVAESLREPLGMCVVRDGSKEHIYVSQRDQILELEDRDGDGTYETKTTVAKAWIADNYHHFTFGLVPKDGFLYASLSTAITGGAVGINGPNPINRGCVMKVDPKRYNPKMPYANVEFVSGGHRTPNGISAGPFDTILVPENQGAWQPADKVNVLYPGMFVGHYNNTEFKDNLYPNGGMPSSFVEQPYEHPAIYLPHNTAANSPCQVVTFPSGRFKDQMLITDIKYGGLRRGWMEMVDGKWQGGVVQFSQGFEVGTNRIVWGPDGNLYVGGTGATETWAWTDPKTGKWTTSGLQRMRATGVEAFEIEKVTATPDGFDVRFTKPIGVMNNDNVSVKQWRYVPTPTYGGPDVDKEKLPIRSMKIASDRLSAHLTIDNLKEGRVVYLNFDIKSKAGEDLWATECWYSLNKRPKSPVSLTHALAVPNAKVLLFTKTTGFHHDSIPTAVAEITKIATARGMQVDATDDASVFTSERLNTYQVVAFVNTTGTVLNAEQKAAFEKYMHTGHGFVGIHSASDTEHQWPFYKQLVGAEFQSHPAGLRDAHIVIEDRMHPSTTFLSNQWRRSEEWYNFTANPRPNVRVLAHVDEKSYEGGSMGDHPVIWCQEFEGGRSWYTELGHDASAYRETMFMESVYQGLLWAAQAAPPAGAKPFTWKDFGGWEKSGDGFTNGSTRRDIFTNEAHGDTLLHVEFNIPKGSNSGVYLQGRYEVQIMDSFGVAAKDLQSTDCGGIYQRWINDEGNEGSAPNRNAYRGPGTWNSFDILFRAPRFNRAGKKIEDARFVEVRLNGIVIQTDITTSGPTRSSAFNDEKPTGPLMLQGDHGGVAFRNVWAKPVKL